MTLQFIQNGNIFDSTCQFLVNPVNCVGVAGKGLALEFKKRFPQQHQDYVDSCKRRGFWPGEIVSYPQLKRETKTIIFFATEAHWKNPSKIQWIKSGLEDLNKFFELDLITSIAIPALGCGLGGLDWRDVRALIVEILGDVEGVRIEVYEPMEKSK